MREDKSCGWAGVSRCIFRHSSVSSMADMEVNMKADMEVYMVADMKVYMVANI